MGKICVRYYPQFLQTENSGKVIDEEFASVKGHAELSEG